MSNTNYGTKTTAELIAILSSFLTAEERKVIENMSVGLKLKLELLEDLKSAMERLNPNMQVDVLEMKLANALALTKVEHGSSLSTDFKGKLLVMQFLGSQERASDVSNFEFMARFGVEEKDLEQIILDAQLKKVVELSETMLEHLSADLVLECKRRINGFTKVEAEDEELLKF